MLLKGWMIYIKCKLIKLNRMKKKSMWNCWKIKTIWIFMKLRKIFLKLMKICDNRLEKLFLKLRWLRARLGRNWKKFWNVKSERKSKNVLKIVQNVIRFIIINMCQKKNMKMNIKEILKMSEWSKKRKQIKCIKNI